MFCCSRKTRRNSYPRFCTAVFRKPLILGVSLGPCKFTLGVGSGEGDASPECNCGL